MALELGDVMWNVDGLARMLGYSLEQIMDMNIQKLAARYQARGLPIKEAT